MHSNDNDNEKKALSNFDFDLFVSQMNKFATKQNFHMQMSQFWSTFGRNAQMKNQTLTQTKIPKIQFSGPVFVQPQQLMPVPLLHYPPLFFNFSLIKLLECNRTDWFGQIFRVAYCTNKIVSDLSHELHRKNTFSSPVVSDYVVLVCRRMSVFCSYKRETMREMEKKFLIRSITSV